MSDPIDKEGGRYLTIPPVPDPDEHPSETAKNLAADTAERAKDLAEDQAERAKDLAADTASTAKDLADIEAARAKALEDARVLLAETLEEALQKQLRTIRIEQRVAYLIAIAIAITAVVR